MVRPKDIAPPYTRAEQQIAIHDHVWYVPVLADVSQFQFPGWQNIFGSEKEVHVEYCSGNGDWIVEKAKLHPDINWLAVEKRFDRTRKIWSKIKNNALSNLVVAFAEATKLSTSFFPEQSICAIYVNFPDPWPKARHAKHRIISEPFFTEAARVLQTQGSLIFVTDDEPYSNYFYTTHLGQTSLGYISMPNASPPETYGTSFFDALFRSQGKSIYYHQLAKI